MNLENVIELYRRSGMPNYNDGIFSATINFHENRELIISLYKKHSTCGSFKEIVVDGVEIHQEENLPTTGEEVSYIFSVNQGSANTFYPSRSEFILTNTIKRGEVPESYYIIADDYSPFNPTKPDYICKIESICNLIKNLAKIAHFNDIKKDKRGSFFKLVFILHSESKSSSAIIETKVSEEALQTKNLDTRIVDSLAAEGAEAENHYIEKLNTFRNTLIEYVNSSSNDFTYLIKNWNAINTLYIDNLAIYMSAFSFHKSRKEVSEAELEFADKISKILSELSTKALAIPISMVASIATFQVTTKSEAFIAFLGIFTTSLITSLLSISMIKQLDRITHAKETLFNGIEGRLLDEKDEIKRSLKNAEFHLIRNEKFCRRVLYFLLVISWVPTYISTFGLLQKIT